MLTSHMDIRLVQQQGSNTCSCLSCRNCDIPIACPVCKAAGREAACDMCEARKLMLQEGGQPVAASEWCCNLDGDLYTLLTDEEEAEFIVKSLKAAAHEADLVPCPQKGCEGLAATEPGDCPGIVQLIGSPVRWGQSY